MSSHAGVEAEGPNRFELNSVTQLGEDVTAPAKEAAEEAVKAVGRQHFTITMDCGAASVAVCIITTEKLMVCCFSIICTKHVHLVAESTVHVSTHLV